MEMKTANALAEKWAELKEKNEGIRIRNAANELGVSEAELLATKVGNGVTALEPKFQDILKEIEGLGHVMALTRNDSVVHERKGTYLNGQFHGPAMGLFVGDDIDLRIFFSCWKFAFAVEEEARGSVRKSIQFFAQDGEAVHKIYLTPSSNEDAFNALVEKFKSASQESTLDIEPWVVENNYKSDEEVDVAAFQEEWRNLKDTHDFFGMLKKHGVSRTQALRLAPEEMVQEIAVDAPRKVLDESSKREAEIMIFVGNKGMIQIHTGPTKKVMEHGPWYNVLDPQFNLHLKETDIDKAYVVKKPTEDGIVTAVECFDKNGEMVVQFFGKRKPGIPELELWRTIVADIAS